MQGKEGDIKRALTNRKRKADLKATVSDAEAINASRRQERQDREKKVEEDGSFGGHGVVARASDTGPKELRILVKGDVSGSVEALAAALEGIGNNQAVTKVIHQSVGEVTESDIMLAHASEGKICSDASIKVRLSFFSSHGRRVLCRCWQISRPNGKSTRHPRLYLQYYLQRA